MTTAPRSGRRSAALTVTAVLGLGLAACAPDIEADGLWVGSAGGEDYAYKVQFASSTPSPGWLSIYAPGGTTPTAGDDAELAWRPANTFTVSFPGPGLPTVPNGINGQFEDLDADGVADQLTGSLRHPDTSVVDFVLTRTDPYANYHCVPSATRCHPAAGPPTCTYVAVAPNLWQLTGDIPFRDDNANISGLVYIRDRGAGGTNFTPVPVPGTNGNYQGSISGTTAGTVTLLDPDLESVTQYGYALERVGFAVTDADGRSFDVFCRNLPPDLEP